MTRFQGSRVLGRVLLLVLLVRGGRGGGRELGHGNRGHEKSRRPFQSRSETPKTRDSARQPSKPFTKV
jgi:hypothetical protein